MAKIKAFKGIRPVKDKVHLVASKPYDVLNSQEARIEAKDNPFSFLHIVKAEIDLSEDIDIHSDAVYEKGRDNLQKFIKENTMFQDGEDKFYLYQQIMGENKQIGLLAASSTQDYFDDIIKKHEFTRPEKEKDRIKHFKTVNAHTGPVFLTYPDVKEMDDLVNAFIKNNEAEYDFTADDGVQHTLWVINDKDIINEVTNIFETKVPFTYIADGHHRAASSAKISKEKSDANPKHSGNEEYNFFLTVIFPANQLNIIDYNRVVKDINGLSEEEFINKISVVMEVEEVGTKEYKPKSLHEFGMYINNKWYKLTAKKGIYNDNNPLEVLDVSILQENVLNPIFNITDPRTDNRIDFVGGIRGLGELVKRVDSGEMKVAFSLYPVTIQQLINIADSGNVMPPKSTWFEPKLRSGVVVHSLD
ncbi:MAG: DUF1015 family protein [Bacteroidota bacterium]|nr:DUF1015 family protein [Bacteroidota bacterium]